MNNKLLFFNKEGYPYNFKQNAEGAYEGKLFFDHNSSDTFKTIALYVFEEVEPIEFIEKVKLNKIEVFNQSGMTFTPSGQVSGATITNIAKVNSNSSFYSKWIHGSNFDQLFPVGSIVSFSNLVFNTTVNDFKDKFYSVIDNKKDAILVISSISNSFWNYTFLNGYLKSHDIMSVNDYNNTTISNIAGFTFHDGKKLNVVDSTSNDGVKTFASSGVTQTIYHQYQMSGNTGDVMRVDVTLLSERPKIYQGGVNFNISGATAIITLDRAINSNISVSEGQQIIFEDMYDQPIHPSNPIFTINDGGTEYDVSNGEVAFEKNENTIYQKLNTFNGKTIKPTYDYYVKIKGEPMVALTKGDSIQLSGVSGSDVLNDSRTLTVDTYKSFRNMRIDYWKTVISADSNWMGKVKAQSLTNARPLADQLELEAIMMYNNNDNNKTSPDYIADADRYNYIKVKEYVIPEATASTYRVNKLIKDTKILYCSVSTTDIFSEFYVESIAYSTSNVVSMTQQILANGNGIKDYGATINAFNTKYKNTLNDMGIYTMYDNNFKIISKYSGNYLKTSLIINSSMSTVNTMVNTLCLSVEDKLVSEEVLLNQPKLFVTNYHSKVQFKLFNNNTSNGFTLFASDFEYHVNFNTNTTTTINDFISTYYGVFYRNGVILSISGSDTLVLDGMYPNINIYNIDAKVNSLSSYKVYDTVVGNGIFITGNEIELPSSVQHSFFNYGVSTGMIITVTGSSYSINNKQYNIIGIGSKERPGSILELSYQGAFFGGVETLTIKTERFLRKPRESYSKDIYYSFRFDMTEEDTQVINDIFFYDISGEQLTPYMGDDRLTYIGKKPLWDVTDNCDGDKVFLNDGPNKNPEWVSDPSKQQTVFRGIDGEYVFNFKLDKYSDSNSYDYTPEPLQVFLGFNSQDEGVSKSSIIMDKVENILYEGYTDSTDYPTGIHYEFNTNGDLLISVNEKFSFMELGFEKGQSIDISFDDTKPYYTSIFPNHGPYTVTGVADKRITVDASKAETPVVYFNTTGNTYSYKFTIKTLPIPVLSLQLFGSTEIEDERLRVGMTNLGLRLDIEDEHIFKQSDINEEGFDYVLLNEKRKELLTVFPEIYNYIGSYKAVINSINFFGWNDLELNEYYRNVNPDSVLFQKLHRVRIPDIFDNTVPGWTTNDWISGKYNNGSWKKTSLFNLTYKITDETGNDVLLYSLDEVQIKLNKLKKWLRKNMMPLSTNLVDITGVAESVSNNYLQNDTSNIVTKAHSSSETTAVNFNFTSTLNFGTNYMFQIDFYTLNGFNPSGWTAKVQTFSKDRSGKLIPQKYYKLMRNDLESFSFNIDKMVDQYIYIETNYSNSYGVGITYNKMTNSSTFKNYLLINNNFKIPKDYKYINAGPNMNGYYYFDKDGYFYLADDRINLSSR